MRRLKNLPSCSSMYYIWLVVGGEDSGLCSCLSQVVGRQDLCDMMKKIVFISIFASSIAGTRRSSGWTTGDCDNYMSGISGGPLHQCNVQIRQMQSMPIQKERQMSLTMLKECSGWSSCHTFDEQRKIAEWPGRAHVLL